MKGNKTHLSPSLLTWLRCFEAVARKGSFTRAAEELHMSQSAVSQQVRQLESRLQVKLLKRLQRDVVVTPEGEPLYGAVHSGFQIINTALGQLRQDREGAPLNITTAPSFAMRWLVPRLAGLFLQHPDIDVRIVADFRPSNPAVASSDGIEAAICYEADAVDSSYSALILDEWLFPVASPAFLKAHPELRHIDDLQAKWLAHDDIPWSGASPYAEWTSWMHAMGVEEFDFQSGQRFNLSQLAANAALSGHGIAMGRAAVVFDDIMAGRLVNVFGSCARAKTSYFFTAATTPSRKALAVEHWLHQEAAAFRALRSKHLPAPTSD